MKTNVRLCRFSSFLFAVLSLCLFNDHAGAQEVVGQRQSANRKLLEKYDLNRNGALDEDEVKLIAKDRLANFDENKDGKLDQAELKAMRQSSRKMPERTAEQKKRALARAKADERNLRKQAPLNPPKKGVNPEGRKSSELSSSHSVE